MLRPASLLVITLAAASGCCHPPHGPERFHENILAVQGTGEAQAKPDVARITLGVESQDASAAAAVQTTNAKIAAVLAAVKQQGVLDQDIQTAQLSIYSEQVVPPYPPAPPPVVAPAPLAPPPSGKAPPAKGAPASKAAPASASELAVAPALPVAPPAPVGPQLVYRATNTVVVTVRKIDTAGLVIGAALAAGANQAGGIQFDVENHTPLEDQARANAVADALHRAQELARLGGVQVGRVLGISEGDVAEGPMPMFAAKVASFRSDGGAVPVEGGLIKVTQTVNVRYALDRGER